MAPLVTLRNVRKVFPVAGSLPHVALHDVTADVEEGARVAISGRSGSGKSTLLALIAGIDVPTSGQVLFAGRDLARLDDDARTRLRRDEIGIVFQFFHLLPQLTLRENVALPCYIAGDPGRSIDARVDELLERVGLAGRADEPVGPLSGGEMQRVAICRALVRRPRLVLADEPTGNLDDEAGRSVMSLLTEIARTEHGTLVYVTHSEELAREAGVRWRIHSGVVDAGAAGAADGP